MLHDHFTILSKSPPLLLNGSSSVLVEAQSTSCHEVSVIVLRKLTEALQISVGETYSFPSLTPCTYSTHTSMERVSSASYVLDTCVSAPPRVSVAPSASPAHSSIAVGNVAQCPIFRPQSVSAKDMSAMRSVSISGVFHHFDVSSRCVTLVSSAELKNSDTKESYVVHVPLHPLHQLTQIASLKKKHSCSLWLHLTHVLPVYLWGRLYGFVATLRTDISSTLGTASRMETSHYDYKQNEENPSMDNRISLYVIWEAYLYRRLHLCSAASSSTDLMSIISYVHSKLSPLLHPQPPIVSTDCLSPIDEFCDISLTALHRVRGGLDADYLCSLLPEIWSVTMIIQFARNVANKVSLKNSGANTFSYSYPPTHMSPLRHETHLCNHDIYLIGTILSHISTYELIALRMIDHHHRALLVLVRSSSKTVTCMAAGHAIAIKNPRILVRIESVGESCVIANISDVHIIKSETCHKIDEKMIESAACYSSPLQLGQFVSAALMGGRATSTISSNSSASRYCSSVREILMMQPITGTRCCISGIVLRKSLNESMYSRSDKRRRSSSTGNSENENKFFIEIRDSKYSDTCRIFVSSAITSACFVGLHVDLYGVVIRLSSNCKYVYGDMVSSDDANIGVIGICNDNHIDRMCVYGNSNLVQQSLQHNALLPPECSILSFHQSRSRNRCMWNIRGNVIAVKYCEVFLRCKRCKQTMKSLHVTCMGKPAVAFHCSRSCGDVSDVWWKCQVVVDDGSSEAHVSVEGAANVQAVLRRFDDKSIRVQERLEEGARMFGSVATSQSAERRVADVSQASADDLLKKPVSSLSLQNYVYLMDSFAMSSRRSLSLLFTVSILYRPAISSKEEVHTRRIKLQRSAAPEWTIDTIDMMTVSVPVIRLQCFAVKIIGARDIAELGYRILNSLYS